MKISDVISDFRTLIDLNVGVNAPGLLDNEIQGYLEDAQLDLIESKVFGDSVSQYGFDGNQKRVSELRSLTKAEGLSVSSITSPPIADYAADLTLLSNTFLYYIDSQSQGSRSDYPNEADGVFQNIYVGFSDLGKFSTFGVNNHFLEPRIAIDGSKLYVKVDSFTTVSSVYLHYIKKPVSIRNSSVDTELDLDEQLRAELVSRAVQRAWSSFGNQGQYQLSSVEEKKESD